MRRRVYVEVTARFDTEGNIRPLSLKFDDILYEIDRVLDVRRAASLKVGGMGMRYTIRVGQNETYLYFEDPRWFVEAKQ